MQSRPSISIKYWHQTGALAECDRGDKGAFYIQTPAMKQADVYWSVSPLVICAHLGLAKIHASAGNATF